MKRFRVISLLAAMALAGIGALYAQQLRTLVTYTYGTGSATEPERGQAMDEATQNAQNWANSACIGTVTNSNVTTSTCLKTGSEDNNNVQYGCTVSVKARCETEHRGR